MGTTANRSRRNRDAAPTEAKIANVEPAEDATPVVEPTSEPIGPQLSETLEPHQLLLLADYVPVKIRHLDFPMSRALMAAQCRNEGLRLEEIGVKLGCNSGEAARALLVFDFGQDAKATTAEWTPQQYHEAVVWARYEGMSWGKVGALLDLTESCARRMFEVATGLKWNSMDFRKRNGGFTADVR